MAIENVVKLMQAAQEKPDLASKLKAVNHVEQLVEIGAGEGFNFTTEEAETLRQKLIEIARNSEDEELTEEALDAVAGGKCLSRSPAAQYVVGGLLNLVGVKSPMPGGKIVNTPLGRNNENDPVYKLLKDTGIF